MSRFLMKFFTPVVILSLLLAACGSPVKPLVEPAPIAPTSDPNAVVAMPTDGTDDATDAPVAVPVPEPDRTIQVIVIDAPADDPLWSDVQNSVEPQYGQYKDDQQVLAGVGDDIALVLMAALTKAGCTTGRWVTNHLVADDAWRIGRMGGVEALDNVILGLKAGTIELVGLGLAGNYNRLGIWFRSLGQDIMIVITKGEGWSTMFPLGVSELHKLGQPILDGVKVFQNIVGYSATTGAIAGYIMINKDDAIWKSVVGELTIGAMYLTTGVAVTKQFLKLFGTCMEEELMKKHQPYKAYKDSKAGNNAPSTAQINIQVSEEEAKTAVVVVTVVVGVIIVIKIAACVAAGQCWVIFIPTPAG